MKVKFNKNILQKVLSVVAPGVARNSPLQQRMGVLFSFGDTAFASTTNERVYIATRVECDAPDLSGIMCFPYAQLAAFVALAADDIVVDYDAAKQRAKLVSGKMKVESVAMYDPTNFPTPNTDGVEHEFNLKAGELLRQLSRVKVAASADENIPVQNTVTWLMRGNKLFLTSMDGFRVAVAKMTWEMLPDTKYTDFTVMLTIEGINALVKILSVTDPERTVSVSFSEHGGQFDMGDTSIFTPTVAGNFPEYLQQIYPDSYESTALCDPRELKDAVALNSIFTDTNNTLRFAIASKRIDIFSDGAQGSGSAQVKATTEGESKFALSARYVSDGIALFDKSDEIQIRFGCALHKRVEFCDPEDSTFTYQLGRMKVKGWSE